MADAFKTLFQGQLGNSVATIATVGAAKSWVVKSITVVNTDVSSRTFGLYKGGTTAAHAWRGSAIALAAGADWVWDGMSETLAAGETIAAGASAAAVVTITISGDEIS